MVVSTRPIPDAVLAVLSDAACDGTTVRLTRQLDRALYVEVNKVLEALGGTWQRRAKAHVFDVDAAARIEQAILSGSYAPLNALEFFRTPDTLAHRVVALAGLHPGQWVLEPSAGDGALVQAITRATDTDALVLHVCEVHDDRRAHLEAAGLEVVAADFLAFEGVCGIYGPRHYDRIVMNPPFSRAQDVQHVTHAWNLLARGGRLVAIMSAGVRFRQDARYANFRTQLEIVGGQIIDNPPDAFKASGSSVNTVTVVLDKPREGADGA